MMVGCSGNPTQRETTVKSLTAKKLNIAADLNFLEALPGLALDSFLFFSTDNLAFRIFFSSSFHLLQRWKEARPTRIPALPATRLCFCLQALLTSVVSL